MSGFKPYPAYKDSGVEWLGEVPEHWNVAPVSRHYQIRNGFPFAAERFSPEGAPEHRLVRIRDILGNDSPIYTDEACPPQCAVDNGDVLIGMDGDFNISYWMDGRAKLNQRVCAVRGQNPARDRFFFYGIGAPLKLINDLTFATTVKHLASSQILKARFPVPPENEVENIARFLDHETARIDALIEEQQRLIELLKEKRQAVISHAVTKGLDPTVPMKDSGVEWLGEVPAHWVVSKLKFMTDRVVDCPHETPNYNPDGEYLVIRTADLDQGLLKPERMYRLDRDEYVHRTRRASLKKNDVVYGREGERWGHAALVPESDLYALGQRMMQVRVAPHICPEYFMFQLNSVAVYRQGEVDTVGATSPHVNISTIINYQMMVPPKEEQSRISMYLNKILLELDSLIRESGDAMGLLQERRSALISAAVTGKIDVRGWQPPASAKASEHTTQMTA